MTAHYFILAIFALAGLVSLLAAVLNWNWFFTARNAQSVVRRVGRNRARLIYGLLGALLMGMAFYFFRSVQAAMAAY